MDPQVALASRNSSLLTTLALLLARRDTLSAVLTCKDEKDGKKHEPGTLDFISNQNYTIE
jgi:hypothetical protein